MLTVILAEKSCHAFVVAFWSLGLYALRKVCQSVSAAAVMMVNCLL